MEGIPAQVIDSRHALTAAGVAAAHRRMHARANIGKILLVPEAR